MSVTERWQKSKHNVPNWKQTCVGMPSLVLSKSRGVQKTAWLQIVRMHTHVGELRAKRHEETLASVQAQKARTALAVSVRPADHKCAVFEGQLNDDINARCCWSGGPRRSVSGVTSPTHRLEACKRGKVCADARHPMTSTA